MSTRNPLKAGVAIRRYIRRFLLLNGIPFIEEKGWLDSVFYIEDKDVFQVGQWLEKNKN